MTFPSITVPATCYACNHCSPDDEGPYAECLKIGCGMGGSLVRPQAAPPAQCPIRKELARVRAGGVLQEAQEALDNGGQAWIDSLADINVGD
mgnify:FL=1